MKGVGFYLEYPNNVEKRKATRKSLGNHSGNVVAVFDGTVFYTSGCVAVECISAVFFVENSPVCNGSVATEYLDQRCKYISERQAREIHPELFKVLDMD